MKTPFPDRECRRTIKGVLLLIVVFTLASCASKRVTVLEVPPENIVTHRVLPGESWETLADDYYGTEKRAEELARFNGMDPDRGPEPGTGIRIPLTGSDLKFLRKRARAIGIYNEGLELASRRKYAQAIEKFDEALKLTPDLDDARYHLGRYWEAAETFRRVLKLNPKNLKSLYSLAVTYEKLNRTDDAVKTWERYLGMDDSSEWADSARRHLQSLREGGGDKN